MICLIQPSTQRVGLPQNLWFPLIKLIAGVTEWISIYAAVSYKRYFFVLDSGVFLTRDSFIFGCYVLFSKRNVLFFPNSLFVWALVSRGSPPIWKFNYHWRLRFQLPLGVDIYIWLSGYLFQGIFPPCRGKHVKLSCLLLQIMGKYSYSW